MKRFLSTAALILIYASVLPVSSFGNGEDAPVLSKPEIMTKALDKVNEIQEFLDFYEMYPDAKFLLAYSSTFDEPRVEGRTLINGRYSFSVGITFSVEADGTLKPQESVSFKLQEINRVRKEKDGVFALFENEWDLTREEFYSLLKSEGDFAAIGFDLVADRPVRNVDKYWEEMSG